MANVPFTTTDCGKTTGEAKATVPLSSGDFVEINGSTDLSSCVVGNSEGSVSSIQLTKPASGIYPYQLAVIATGPSGLLSGSIDLTFTDGTNEDYTLSITDSKKKTHSLGYSSDSPGIVSFKWGS